MKGLDFLRRRYDGVHTDTRRSVRRSLTTEPELRYFAGLARRRPQTILRAIVAEMGGLSAN
jgi:hypothetical protein